MFLERKLHKIKNNPPNKITPIKAQNLHLEDSFFRNLISHSCKSQLQALTGSLKESYRK